MRALPLIAIAIFCMSMACNRSTTDGNKESKVPGCPGNVICTQMFAMVTVDVRNADGGVPNLDKTETIRKSTGKDVAPEKQMGNGSYIVLDDAYIKNLQNQKDEFTFKGYIGNKVVVEETYLISADCCHIKKESGASELTIK